MLYEIIVIYLIFDNQTPNSLPPINFCKMPCGVNNATAPKTSDTAESTKNNASK